MADDWIRGVVRTSGGQPFKASSGRARTSDDESEIDESELENATSADEDERLDGDPIARVQERNREYHRSAPSRFAARRDALDAAPSGRVKAEHDQADETLLERVERMNKAWESGALGRFAFKR